MAETRIRGVLLDLGGVVYVGDTPLPGALEALGRLREAGLALRFLTNTTRRSARRLLADLARIGIALAPDELLTPARLARDYLAAHGLTPHLLVHANLEEEFAGLPAGGRAAVVVGDAADRFTYATLNAAFRRLEAGAEFIALAGNRNFRDADGALSIDAGAFVKALEYASGREARMMGKPAAAFFRLAVAALGCAPAEAAMVGDDAEADVGGALSAGLMGVLVRSGKYRPGDETALDPAPTHVAEDLAAAVAWILRGEAR
jgi:HAD superfamily hydrolase (TIGR01458 family)